MLQIKNIEKQYKTGSLVQRALDDVSLSFRDSEFVSVLGPSGSGKTTLLNIIGGLDQYDSGELIVNGISTKKYKDKDWDSYIDGASYVDNMKKFGKVSYDAPQSISIYTDSFAAA